MIDARSGHAAVAAAAASVTLDDGEVERRIRLIRPAGCRTIAEASLAGTPWQEAVVEAFSPAWTAEVASLPEFVESRFWIVTGLLLPIWRRLPQDGCRVYRLQTDAGERVIGCRVPADWVAQALGGEAPAVAPAAAWTAVLEYGGSLQLADGLSVRRSLVMGLARVELAGFSDGMVDRLKAMGLVAEIISWRLRLFIPTGANGPDILAALLARHQLTRIVAKASINAAAA